MGDDTVFALRYAWWLRPLFALLGMGPRMSGAELVGDELRVRMGPAFRARIPLRCIAHVEPEARLALGGWGVHGWGGRWLVNGSAGGLVRLTLSPAGRARVVGMPVRLRTLRMSMVDPDGFVAAVHRSRAAIGG